MNTIYQCFFKDGRHLQEVSSIPYGISFSSHISPYNPYINKPLTNSFNSDCLVDWLLSNLLPVQFWFGASLKPFGSRTAVLALVSGHGIVQRERERVALHFLHTDLPKAGSLSIGRTVWHGTVSVHWGHFLNRPRPLLVRPVPHDGERTGCDVDRTGQVDGIALDDLRGIAGQRHCYVALWKRRERLWPLKDTNEGKTRQQLLSLLPGVNHICFVNL